MCEHPSDARAEEESLFFDLLCEKCQRMVEEAGCRLFDKAPEDWGFCGECMADIRKEEERKPYYM